MAKKQEGSILSDLQAIPDTFQPEDKPKATKKQHLKPTKPKTIEVAKKPIMGRPALFTSPEEMQEKIDEYFAYCDNRVTSMYVKEMGDNVSISNPAPYTMSGLAMALGMDRQSLINYSKKDDFFGTVKKARQRVENDVETRLMEGKNQAGAIFNLKNNFGYVDKIENEMSMKEMPKPIISLPQPPRKGIDDEESAD